MAGPPVTIGILGTARVATYALIDPVASLPGISIAAVGSRDPARARAFADRYGIPRSGSYEDVIADPDIDVVYVALTNDLHCAWSLRSLAAGKAVLCEKPLATNAEEAAACVTAARKYDLPFIEAFHWRYHPIATRLQALVARGELGRILSVDTHFTYAMTNPDPGEFRLDYALGGGVFMDAGCYAVNLARLLLGEPVGVRHASALLHSPEVDVEMDTMLEYSGGATGRIFVANNVEETRVVTTLTGEAGTAAVHNAFLPMLGCRIDFERDGRTWTEELDPRSSYHFQALAVADVVRGKAKELTTVEDAVANLNIVDSVYRAAGLKPRALDGVHPE